MFENVFLWIEAIELKTICYLLVTKTNISGNTDV